MSIVETIPFHKVKPRSNGSPRKVLSQVKFESEIQRGKANALSYKIPLARKCLPHLNGKLIFPQSMTYDDIQNKFFIPIQRHIFCFRELEGSKEDEDSFWKIVGVSFIEYHVENDNPKELRLKKIVQSLRGEKNSNMKPPYIYLPSIKGRKSGEEFIEYLTKYCGGNGILRSSRHVDFMKALNNINYVLLMGEIFFSAFKKAGSDWSSLSYIIWGLSIPPAQNMTTLLLKEGVYVLNNNNHWYFLSKSMPYSTRMCPQSLPQGDDPIELGFPESINMSIYEEVSSESKAIQNIFENVTEINRLLIQELPNYTNMINNYSNLVLFSTPKLDEDLVKMDKIHEETKIIKKYGVLYPSLSKLTETEKYTKFHKSMNQEICNSIQDYKFFLQNENFRKRLRILEPCLEKFKIKCSICQDNGMDNPRIQLECKHIMCKKCLMSKVESLVSNRKTNAPLQIKCLMKACFNMLSMKDIVQIVGQDNYTKYIKEMTIYQGRRSKVKQCGICLNGSLDGLSTLHYDFHSENSMLEHNVCNMCLENYISYMTKDNIIEIDFYKFKTTETPDINCIIPIKCPFRGCQMVIDYPHFIKLYKSHQIEYMIDKAFREAGVRRMPQNMGEDYTKKIGNIGLKAKTMCKLATCNECGGTENLTKRFPTCDENCRSHYCRTHLHKLVVKIHHNNGKCPHCQKPIKNEFKRQIFKGEIEFLETYIYQEERLSEDENLQTTKRLRDLRIKCDICQFNFTDMEMRSLWSCEHRYCIQCLRDYIEHKYKEGKCITQIYCPGCTKGNISIHIIRELCGKKIATSFEERYNKLKRAYVICPRCENNCDRSVANSKDINICCYQCRYSFCRLCRKQTHHGSCVETARQNATYIYIYIQYMKLCNEAGLVVSTCPYCLQIFAKDEACGHVKCFNCENDYCFRCSCKRSPYMAHGCHYHRSNCKFYSYIKIKDKYSKECTACDHVNKKPCQRPGRLENGDIPECEKPTIYSWR